MTILGSLGELRGDSPEDPVVPLTSKVLLEWLGAGRRTASGRSVNEKSALAMAAVWRCVALISGVSASLPLHTFEAGSKTRTSSPLLDDPHPELTPLELWRLTYVHKALWGNGYLQKLRNPAGQVRELSRITPDRVGVTRERPDEANPSGKFFDVTDDWGVPHVLTPRDVLHLPGLGYDGICGVSPTRAASQGVGLALPPRSTAPGCSAAGT